MSIVESLRHPVIVATPNVADNRLKPTRQRPCHPLQRLLGTLARALNQLQKGFPSRLFICTIEPHPQVLYPVNDFAQLGKAPSPLITGNPLVHIELIGGFQPALAQLLERFGLLCIEPFLHRAHDLVKRTHSLLHHMEAVNHLSLLAKEGFDGRRVRLGHIQHDDFNLIAFGLRTTLKPGDDLLGTSSLEGRNGLASVHVDNQCVLTMPLAPGILINAKGSAKRAWAATPAPLKSPAKHGALRETRATGEYFARASSQVFLSHLAVEPFGPLHMLAEGLTRFPRTMPAIGIGALKASYMQPQHDGELQDRQITDTPRSALFDLGATRLATGTHDGGVSAFEMQRKLLWTENLTDNAKCWETEQRFDTMEIHEHGFLLLALCSSRILRGIRCLSITGSQPLPIGLRRWPQTWRRAKKKSPNRSLRASQDIVIVASQCPACKSTDLIHGVKKPVRTPKPRVKRAFDLVLTPSGIQRKIIACRTSVHQCLTCGAEFVPDQHERLDRHYHGLKSWAMFQHVAYRISLEAIPKMAEEFFGIRIFQPEMLMIKSFMAEYYKMTYRRLLKNILSGHLLHVDETEVKLQQGKGYVWVFTNLEEVVYIFRPNREGDFLRELLKDFHGVLVSDFYAAYDALPCPQQKCLIHLMRDLNQELLDNPYDDELKAITHPFGRMLRAVIETIDQHGLQQQYLVTHHKETTHFFQLLTAQSFRSESA